MSKQEMRKRLASLSFSEKVKVLERLRDRDRVIAAGGLRRNAIGDSEHLDQRKRFCTCLGWEPCGCGSQPPYHCTNCCLELTPEQIAAARERGWYSKEES